MPKIVIPGSGSGWTMHAKGVGGLMERLGPKPFNTGVLHRMFIGFRPLLVCFGHPYPTLLIANVTAF